MFDDSHVRVIYVEAGNLYMYALAYISPHNRSIKQSESRLHNFIRICGHVVFSSLLVASLLKILS